MNGAFERGSRWIADERVHDGSQTNASMTNFRRTDLAQTGLA